MSFILTLDNIGTYLCCLSDLVWCLSRAASFDSWGLDTPPWPDSCRMLLDRCFCPPPHEACHETWTRPPFHRTWPQFLPQFYTCPYTLLHFHIINILNILNIPTASRRHTTFAPVVPLSNDLVVSKCACSHALKTQDSHSGILRYPEVLSQSCWRFKSPQCGSRSWQRFDPIQGQRKMFLASSKSAKDLRMFKNCVKKHCTIWNASGGSQGHCQTKICTKILLIHIREILYAIGSSNHVDFFRKNADSTIAQPMIFFSHLAATWIARDYLLHGAVARPHVWKTRVSANKKGSVKRNQRAEQWPKDICSSILCTFWTTVSKAKANRLQMQTALSLGFVLEFQNSCSCTLT